MNFTLVVIENIVLFLLVPQVLRSASQKAVQTIDNRNMFEIPFCSSVATACGALLAIVFLLCAGVVGDAAPARLWGFDGPWHTGRLMSLLVTYTSALWYGGVGEQVGWLWSSVSFLLLCTAILTLVNALVAVAGWRSIQAVRGMATHLILSASNAVIFVIWALTALWALHWLNFWIFLVLRCVFEMRRRESGAVRLSF